MATLNTSFHFRPDLEPELIEWVHRGPCRDRYGQNPRFMRILAEIDGGNRAMCLQGEFPTVEDARDAGDLISRSLADTFGSKVGESIVWFQTLFEDLPL